MAGTKAGAAAAVKSNMELYGADYYARIGSKGGSVKGVPKGFGAGQEGKDRASKYGALGGKKSRRTYGNVKKVLQ